MFPPLLRELADVIARPVLITFQRLWQLEDVSKDWEKKEDSEKHGLVNPNSVHRVVLEQMTLKTISKHIKDKKIIIQASTDINGRNHA